MAPRDIPRLSTPFLIHISKRNGATGWRCFKNNGLNHFLVWQQGSWVKTGQTAFSRWTGRCFIPYWLHPWPGGGKSLRQGDRIPAVWDVQQWLETLGLFEGPGGYFDRETMEAIKIFQKQAGLKPDGVAGPQTLAFLFHWARSIEKNENNAKAIKENGNDAKK